MLNPSSHYESGAPYGTLSQDEESLWRRYLADRADLSARELLLELHLPLVRAELGRISCRLPSHIDREELYSEGLMGLLAALTHFDPDKGVAFAAYARKRIWGAMIDRVRSLDGVPRSVRKASRRISCAIDDFVNRNGRQPDEAELAHTVGVSVEDLRELERQAILSQTLSLDAACEGRSGAPSTFRAEDLAGEEPCNDRFFDQLASQEAQVLLVDGLKALPDRERAIIVLYYQQGLMQKEIAEAMNVSESRVSQLHNRAILRLRAFLERSAGQRHATLTKSAE